MQGNAHPTDYANHHTYLPGSLNGCETVWGGNESHKVRVGGGGRCSGSPERADARYAILSRGRRCAFLRVGRIHGDSCTKTKYTAKGAFTGTKRVSPGRYPVLDGTKSETADRTSEQAPEALMCAGNLWVKG